MRLEGVRGGSLRALDDPGEPVVGQPRISIAEDEVIELRRLLAGRAVLEIGTGLGVSTRALAAAARRVVTVDIDPWVQAQVWPELAQLGVETASDVRSVVGIDAAFIDGLHTVEAVEADTRAALAAGATLLVYHDASFPEVWEGSARAGCPFDYILPTTWGLGVYEVKL